MTVVTFLDVTPPERADGNPWTKAFIQEASVRIGPYNELPVIVLNPVDADPTHPQNRDLTTSAATLQNGWYRLVFEDAAGGRSGASEAMLNAPDYALPSVRDIGQKLLSRTRTRGGLTIGTFNDNTAPLTAEVVQGYIEVARDEVYGKIGDQTEPHIVHSAREAVALYAAMQIELGIFSEQVTTNRSPYGELKKLWDAKWLELEDLVGEGLPEDDDPNTPSRMGSYAFPPTEIGDGVLP
jgi:hypothetical protein